MKITFPHMGNTFIPAKVLLDELNLDYVIPPPNNKKALEIGTQYAPEMACLPLKINIGNFIQAFDQGADTIMITGGHGPCRFGYYGEMHREILQDAGYPMDVITLEYPDEGLGELAKRVKKLAGTLNPYKLIKTMKNVTIISKRVDELEALSFKIRPVEIIKGSTDKIYKSFLRKALFAKGYKAVKNLIQETEDILSKVKTDPQYPPLKVGIVGEIYTTIDSFANQNLAAVLGNLGVEVHRYVNVSGWIIDHMIKPALGLPRDKQYAKEAKAYLGTMIGGHAQETVGNSILYSKAGFDGIIQVYPLTCMPEIVAEGILTNVGGDYDIPVLTLIIDEMTGEAGYLTRVEAFVDLLDRRREKISFGENAILSGN